MTGIGTLQFGDCIPASPRLHIPTKARAGGGGASVNVRRGVWSARDLFLGVVVVVGRSTHPEWLTKLLALLLLRDYEGHI